jgi:hypothetical protein
MPLRAPPLGCPRRGSKASNSSKESRNSGKSRSNTSTTEEDPWSPDPATMDGKMAEALRKHVAVVSDFLRVAASCGKVIIITLAKPGWVETSANNFLPGLQPVLAELKIKVLYARTMLASWKMRVAVLDQLDVLKLMKQAAMERFMRKHYASRPDKSWKNVVCIGDSATEHDALREVVYCHVAPDGTEPCRCKTVKMLEIPTLPQLTSQLEALSGHLKHFATHDGDAHTDVSSGPSRLEEALRSSSWSTYSSS